MTDHDALFRRRLEEEAVADAARQAALDAEQRASTNAFPKGTLYETIYDVAGIEAAPDLPRRPRASQAERCGRPARLHGGDRP